MSIRSLVGLVALGAAVHAQQGSLEDDCTDVTLVSSTWMVGDCASDAENTTTIASSVYLPSFIGNNNGNLEWKENGNFPASCRDCSISSSSSSTLTCSCAIASHPSYQLSTLDLSQHISPYSGFLLSDLGREPSPPAGGSSPVPVPRDSFAWSLSLGEEGCYTEVPGQLNCAAVPPVETPGACAASPSISSGGNPKRCGTQVLPVPNGPVYWAFQAVSVGMDAPWDVKFFATLDCSGEPLEVLDGGGDAGVCLPMEDYAVSWSITPSWNADW